MVIRAHWVYVVRFLISILSQISDPGLDRQSAQWPVIGWSSISQKIPSVRKTFHSFGQEQS